MRTAGPLWGLDDIESNILNDNIEITTSTLQDWYTGNFDNEHGRVTTTVYSPQWWFGIEATAAELKARRDNLKKDFPNAIPEWLDAAASGAFNYGEAGIRNNLHLVDQFRPFIKLNRK